MRECRTCLVNKKDDAFYPGRRICKACVIKRVALWKQAHPEADRVDHQRHKVARNKARVERQRLEDGSRQAKYRKNHPDRHAAAQQRRRALKAGNGFEKYERKEIYDRDGGICKLCDESIDVTIVWPHPMSFSIDHIIPVSQGGPDVPANVQASHMVCNIRKGAFVGAGG